MINSVQTLVAGAVNPRYLNLILLPTEKCNFRCTYCYESFEIGQMSQEISTGIKSLITRRLPDLDSLVISWFGGEPLIARSVVLDISSFIVESLKRFPNVRYGGSITTNGHLLDLETFETLTSLGVNRFQISLDGPETVHNKTRIQRGGAGTFRQIWDNLIAISVKSSKEALILLRIHYSPSTWKYLFDLIEDINSVFGEDKRFVVFFKSIERLGGDNDDEIEVFDKATKEKIKRTLGEALKYDRMRYESANEENYICYASQANSFIIRANGDLAKCTVALYEEHNKIGKILPDGKLEIEKQKILPWLHGLETRDAKTLACPYNQIKKLPIPVKIGR